MSDKFCKFEEYKLFVEDTARFSERRETVTNIYVVVNSIILTASSFTIKEISFSNSWHILIVLPLLTAGFFISFQWRRIIEKYRRLIGFRIGHLRKMEDDPEFNDSVKMYHLEDELFPRDENGKDIPGAGLNFSDLEKILPLVFMVLYCICSFFLICLYFFLK